MSQVVEVRQLHSVLFLTMLAWVFGTGYQLTESSLNSRQFYFSLTIAALIAVFIVVLKLRKAKNSLKDKGKGKVKAEATVDIKGKYSVFILTCILSMTAAFLAYALTGLRASNYLENTFLPTYEGRDLEVIGVIASLPNKNEMGTRFHFDVESVMLINAGIATAEADLKLLSKLSKISLSWYGGVLGIDDSDKPQNADLDLLPKASSVENTGEERNTGEENDLLTSSSTLRSMKIFPGERWKMTVRLKAPHGNSNPGGFDYELWSWEQSIQATGYVRTGKNDAVPRRLALTWQHTVEQLRFKVRDAIFSRMNRNGGASLPNVAIDATNTTNNTREAGIIAALVTGDQQSIDRADWDVFRNTGVAHLMSISGLHITMFAWGAVIVVGWLYRRSSRLCLMYPSPQAALIGGLLLATLYAVFSGWGVPSQRTIWMLATITLLRLLGKRWPWQSVWMLACCVVLMIDPWALLQAGFWLSFVAVGVLFASDSNQKGIRDKLVLQSLDGARSSGSDERSVNLASAARQRLDAVKRAFWLNGREQIIITLALTPLTLLLFGQVSVVGLVANAIAIPWVTLVVTPLAMLGTVYEPLWNIAGFAVHILTQYLGVLNALPFAIFSMATPPVLLSVIGVLGAVLMVMPWPWQIKSIGLPLLLTVILWQAPRPEAGQFELIAADIGQGNGLIVRTAEHTLVYDAGPRYSIDSDAGNRVLVPLLRRTNEAVSTVMLSHRDIDHSGGVKSVLSMYPKAKFISSVESSHDLQAFRPVQRCIAGQSWQWDGIDFEVLHPFAEDYDMPNKSNAMSCVLRVSNKEHSALLVGDIEKAQELRLVSARVSEQQNNVLNSPSKLLKSTVLLVPHHGSKTSSSEEFLDAVQPQLAIVQAGYRNRFGHPAPSVMQRYQDRQIKVIDTARCGAMSWSSATPRQVQCNREANKRYWQHQLP